MDVDSENEEGEGWIPVSRMNESETEHVVVQEQCHSQEEEEKTKVSLENQEVSEQFGENPEGSEEEVLNIAEEDLEEVESHKGQTRQCRASGIVTSMQSWLGHVGTSIENGLGNCCLPCWWSALSAVHLHRRMMTISVNR